MGVEISKDLPGAAGDLEQHHPTVWAAYAALGEATADAGGADCTRAQTGQAGTGRWGSV